MRALHSSPRVTLFLVGMVTGLLVTSGDPGSDTLRRLQVTHSLWTRELPVRPEEYPGFGIPGRGGTIHAWYGIGQSLAMLPGDVLATLALRDLRVSQRIEAKARPVLVCLLTFPVLAGLTLVALFSLLRKLGFSRNVAGLATLAMQFGTGHLTYTQIHQENSLLMLLAAAGLALTARTSEDQKKVGHSILGLQMAGATILVRLTAVLDFVAVVVIAGATRMSRASGRLQLARLRQLALPALASLGFYLVLDRIYQWLRFVDITTTYIHLYGRQARLLDPSLPKQYPFTTPFAEGFFGPFFSPQRSVFLLEPLLTLTLVILVSRWKRIEQRPKTSGVVFASLLLAQVSFYAKYYDWAGASAWGDRFITVPLHLLAALGVAMALSQWSTFRSLTRKAIAALVTVAVMVQMASVTLWYNLEEAQANYWHRPALMPWQRFVNLAAVVLGRFERWELTYPGFTERSTRWNFLPFLAESYLPPNVAAMFKMLWLVAVAALLAFVARVARSLWRAQRAAMGSTDDA